ncbi:hypothetical protein ACGF0J_37885 [Nonomuraea sp. NPDC047897]|uniref:hypothetical protein n=1 Tax=Nonomuraea sp. NPDC047897 TaxID=3364346 RepID=UPI00371BBFA9
MLLALLVDRHHLGAIAAMIVGSSLDSSIQLVKTRPLSELGKHMDRRFMGSQANSSTLLRIFRFKYDNPRRGASREQKIFGEDNHRRWLRARSASSYSGVCGLLWMREVVLVYDVSWDFPVGFDLEVVLASQGYDI